jgi:hypothetical protein
LNYRSGGYLHIEEIPLPLSEVFLNPFPMPWQTGEGYLKIPGAVLSREIGKD